MPICAAQSKTCRHLRRAPTPVSPPARLEFSQLLPDSLGFFFSPLNSKVQVRPLERAASYETRTKLASSIRVLCNADLSGGFKIGKDVSLPETYIRSAQNPQRDLGGNPGDQRPILAFYAGGVHGSLRQSLLDLWENKDPTIKIYRSKFPGIEGKMTYIQHMKTSKYCICPRGYEVNSPRIVEAIFYECVPVIISDNFVPPFFEVLEWEAFAIFIAEKDIPNLKKILLSIPEENYLYMQNGVKRVQRHFIWHSSPIKQGLLKT